MTKRGKPVAVLTLPPDTKPFHIPMIYGSQRGSVIYNDPDIDLTAPICDEIFNAELGILHR